MKKNQMEEESVDDDAIRVNRATGNDSKVEETLSPEIIGKIKQEIDVKTPSPKKVSDE